MSGNLTEALVTIATAIVGLAIIATLVSRNANTASIIQNAGSAFGNTLGVAESPVTGATYAINLGYAGNNSGFSPSAFG